MKIPRALAVLLLLPAALLAGDPTFDTWVDKLSADWMRLDPNTATSAQFFTGAEQDAIDRQLTPNSRAWQAERVAFARRILDELARFDRTRLNPSQVVSARILEWEMNSRIAAAPYQDHQFVFDQFQGLHITLVNFLSQTHPIRNRRDIENYLVRLEQVAGQMDEGIAQAKDAATRGFLMPEFITQSVIGQFDRFLGDTPTQNVLVASLAERAAKTEGVSAEDKAALLAAAEKIVTDAIIPAFQRVRALLQEQLPRTTADAGLWRLPGGEQAYAVRLAYYTTSNLTPQEIHETGRREVARIEALLDGLFRQLGYTEGSIKERYDRLNADLQPPADPDPRPGLIARHEEILADAVKRSESLFDLRPAAPCIVKREPPFSEKNAANHYTEPAPDGSRPGIFWAPLPGPVFRIPYMRTLTYHEGVPGHHFQIALQQEMTDLPRFRRDGIFGFISAHGEGWALYAEQLAAENGWYEGDLVGQIGQLEAELFRARRLVVDTGIHTMKWTRQQAIDFGMLPREVERYVVLPGQACSYKIGQLRILDLRAKAQKALGDKFSIKEFHNTVLRAGSMPLSVLESVVDDWIAATRDRQLPLY